MPSKMYNAHKPYRTKKVKIEKVENKLRKKLRYIWWVNKIAVPLQSLFGREQRDIVQSG